MQSTISNPNFFFLFSSHKHNPSHLLPVLEMIAFFFFFSKINCATKLMRVSCHLSMALYATLKLKSVSSALVTLDFTCVIGEKLSQPVICLVYFMHAY